MVLFNQIQKGRKMKKILMSVIAMGTMVVSVQATCASYGCNGNITTLRALTDGSVLVGTDGDETQMNCTPVSGQFALLRLSDAGGNAAYSALLTAKTTNTPILVRIVEGTTNCQVGYIAL